MFAVRIAACLSLLAGFSLQVDVKSGKEAGKAGNFMEDEQWLSTISQYSRKIKHWNRFRDVSGVFLCVLFCFVVLPARVVVAVGALTSEVLDVCGGDGARRFWRSGDFLFLFFFFLRTVDWAQTHAQHEQFVRKKNTWDDQTLCLMTWLIHQHQLFLSPPHPSLTFSFICSWHAKLKTGTFIYGPSYERAPFWCCLWCNGVCIHWSVPIDLPYCTHTM